MKKNTNVLLIFIFYSSILLALFLYSYTQTDLSLTISRVNFLQQIQELFQHVGFYERPLSTALYIGILISLCIVYVVILRLVAHGALTRKHVWGLIATGVVLLVFSYPAFSYDIFNYMFTAKTVLVYRENPYEVIPGAFAAIDPRVSVMRWIHLPSAYSPAWIVLTLPFYLFGLGFFLPTLFSFKMIAIISYVVTVWAIGKILEVLDKDHALLGMVIYACNPIVIMETLVSAHNDSVMMAVVTFGLLLFVRHRKFTGIFVLSLSAAIKTMTMILLPVMLVATHRKNLPWREWSLAMMLSGFIFVILEREVLPWYWLWILPFVALLPRLTWLTVLSTGVSLGLLLRYAPYLYLGHWNNPVPVIKMWVTAAPIVVFLVGYGVAKHFKR